MSGHAVPFYCPYCGEEDIVPAPPPDGAGEGHGYWACQACRRGFRLRLVALVTAPASEQAADQQLGLANGTAVAPSDVKENR